MFSGAAAAVKGLDGMPGRLPPHALAQQQTAVLSYFYLDVHIYCVLSLSYLQVLQRL